MIMQVKIPYAILALNIERLYQKDFREDQLAEIQDHCELIAIFIGACGWQVEEYFERWMREGEGN